MNLHPRSHPYEKHRPPGKREASGGPDGDVAPETQGLLVDLDACRGHVDT